MFTTYNNPIHVEDNFKWGIYLFLFIVFIIMFIFRKQLTQIKETAKAKLRTWLYQYVQNVSVKNDTVKTQESGILLKLVSFLDEKFLMPADENHEEESYRFLLDEEVEEEKTEEEVEEEVEEEEEEVEEVEEEEDDDDEEEAV